MDAAAFARKWKASTANERAGSQSQFNDICDLIGEPKPNDPGQSRDIYTFERGLSKTTSGRGYADVWLKDRFGWEYKSKGDDLKAAYVQLLNYHESLGQPPLLVVSDMERFEVHTKYTGTEAWVYRFTLDHIASGSPVSVTTAENLEVPSPPDLNALQVLKALFDDRDLLKPGRTTEAITREAADAFFDLATSLRKWPDVNDIAVARFISRMVFCMFASDVGLLDKGTFSELLRVHSKALTVQTFEQRLERLFEAMQVGGDFGAHDILRFNGDLFTDAEVPRLTDADLRILTRLDDLNWADVEPAIFGTLFERVLKETDRRKLGAHYTSRADIELLVEPVLMAPLRHEWEQVRDRATEAMLSAREHNATEETERERLRAEVAPFLDRLATIRVLDPACGSGNFLYVALSLLKALEKESIAFAGLHGVRFEPRVHPRQLHGIEINEYAHELASIVIWIGYLQWKHRNSLELDNEDPVLQKLEQIRLMDAILDLSDPANPREPEWPEADVIVGNPPFLGTKKMIRELGEDYVKELRDLYRDRIPGFSDLCCYWFEKARAIVAERPHTRVGLLATQGIRGGRSRVVLKRIKETGDIYFAEADRPWILDGAAVHVSMVGFDDGSETERWLDGAPVEGINSDLTRHSDLTTARKLDQNAQLGYVADVKGGRFEISDNEARAMLAAPNPHGKPNSDVVRPWMNGLDVTRRPRRMWIVDYPPDTSESDAAKYERPFSHILKHVKPAREGSEFVTRYRRWWVHARPGPAMRTALDGLSRFIATPSLTKHRLFVWLGKDTLPDHQLVVFARDDDYFFGVLHSKPHELWARATGTQLREATSGFRYTPTTCFETFPLPWPPGSEPTNDPRVEAIAAAARELNELREGWLNPPQGTAQGDDEYQKFLKKRTLTNLYNERPTWLDHAHRQLDEAVFAAYGWPSGLSDPEILERLLKLNHERATKQDGSDK